MSIDIEDLKKTAHSMANDVYDYGLGIQLVSFVDEFSQLKAERELLRLAGESLKDDVKQLKAENEVLRKDAERYRRLRDGGYLDKFVSVHPCDENRRTELTDEAIDRVMGTE